MAPDSTKHHCTYPPTNWPITPPSGSFNVLRGTSLDLYLSSPLHRVVVLSGMSVSPLHYTIVGDHPALAILSWRKSSCGLWHRANWHIYRIKTDTLCWAVWSGLTKPVLFHDQRKQTMTSTVFQLNTKRGIAVRLQKSMTTVSIRRKASRRSFRAQIHGHMLRIAQLMT